ncbi:MAG: ATP-binding protein [Planctomycetes bacterium]|nr:ATP-binding protein [Planctomycetota bacterium]
MQDYEKLGVFYLGKRYDLEGKRPVADDLLLYDAKDLTTHAVCVGMTGSGKTGLCLALLEEAAIDGIPSICIDPKGDLGNLLLAFPELRPGDFEPWIERSDAARSGMTPDEYAARMASIWKDGLAAWGQPPERIARYRDAVDLSIYTPASNAGLPLTVMRSFAPPGEATLNNSEAMRERVSAAASGLLALLGIDSDSLQSREHILLSTILDRSWRDGNDVDLGTLIRLIQKPGFDKVGFMDLESFFPSKDRFAFAMSLNNLIASPGFQAWMEGESLDIQRLLYTPAGKPRLSIISIAHLSDSERMFFVTILLNEMISWMRNQSGTSSLRALLYMDEVFGYFPPTANPPSKTPMLTLMKQARAFGLGVVLATQNPVDIDYKGLSNAGTWFLGRLQTERDKARVLDGLEGASAAAGSRFDRAKMESILSGLGNRVFLMNNVHEDEPVVFQSRWALSFLRGPINRDQIATLMAEKKASQPAAAAPVKASLQETSVSSQPVLPPGIDQTFLVRRSSMLGNTKLLYRPGLLGSARIRFAYASTGVDELRDITIFLAAAAEIRATVWDDAEISTDEFDQQSEGEDEGGFAPLPTELSRAKTFTELQTALKDHLYRTQKLQLWKCPELKLVSQPGESEGDFRARITHGVREGRDLQVEKLRTKFAPRLAGLQEQLRKAYQRVEKQKAQASQQTFTAAVNLGTSILGAVFGRKLTSATNISKAATTIRSASRVASERQDVAQAEETVEAIQERIDALNTQFQEEANTLIEGANPDGVQLEEISVAPKKSDITVVNLTLCWTPWTVDAKGVAQQAW